MPSVNRRSFISLLAGAAGAPLVPWRGLVEPRIFLPTRELSFLELLRPYVERWKRTTDAVNREMCRCYQTPILNPAPYTATFNFPDRPALVLDAWPADEAFEVNWS